MHLIRFVFEKAKMNFLKIRQVLWQDLTLLYAFRVLQRGNKQSAGKKLIVRSQNRDAGGKSTQYLALVNRDTEWDLGEKHTGKESDATFNKKRMNSILFMTNTAKEINICHKDLQKYSKIKVPILLDLNIPVTKAAKPKRLLQDLSF